jgi:hypothetical protein
MERQAVCTKEILLSLKANPETDVINWYNANKFSLLKSYKFPDFKHPPTRKKAPVKLTEKLFCVCRLYRCQILLIENFFETQYQLYIIINNTNTTKLSLFMLLY